MAVGGAGNIGAVSIDIVPELDEEELKKLLQHFGALGSEINKTLAGIKFGEIFPTELIDKQISRIDAAIKRLVSKDIKLFPHIKDEIRALEQARSILAGTLGEVKESAEGGGALSGLDNFLKGFGLSVRNISVLLGAGLATGAAGIIRIGEKLVDPLKDFIVAEVDLEHETDRTFRNSADSITDFANRTASSLGLSRREALETANAFGLLARQLDLPEALGARFAESLATATAALESAGVPGAENIEKVAQAVQKAIEGNDDALKQLGLTLDDIREESLKSFGKLPDILTDTQKAVLAYNLITKQGAEETRVLGEQHKSFWASIVDPFSRFFHLVKDGTESLKFEHLASAVALDKESASVKRLNQVGDDELKILRSVAPEHSKVRDRIDEVIASREKLAAEQEANAARIAKEIEALHLEEKAFLANQKAIDAAVDAFRTLRFAQEDGIRAIAEAEERLRRTREDNLQKAIDLSIRSGRAEEDANVRITKARNNLADVQEQNRRRAEDIDDKIKDQREKTFRSERDALEKLEDLRKDHQRKEEDLQLRIKKAKQDEADAILDATLDIGQALRKGDVDAERSARLALARAVRETGQQGELASARRDLAREREDFVEKEKRLERDLAELKSDNIRDLDRLERERTRQQLDAERDLRKAEQELEDARRQAQRAREDAIIALNKLEIEQNRALRDAMKGIDDAERNMERAVDAATLSIERMARELGITVTRLREIVGTLNAVDLAKPGGLNLFGFQHGGDLALGKVGFAGERGRELVIGGSRGSTILPHDLTEALIALAKGQRSAGSHSIVINEVANDPEATAAAVSARLARSIG